MSHYGKIWRKRALVKRNNKCRGPEAAGPLWSIREALGRKVNEEGVGGRSHMGRARPHGPG